MKIKKNRIYDFFSIFGFIYIILISFLIYARIDENGTIVSKIFSSNINFTKFNDNIDDFFSNIFHIGNNENDKEVDLNVTYLSLGEHKYKQEDIRILALEDGTISYITTENDTYAIVINYGSYQTIYRNVVNPSVGSMDHILEGETIGEYEDFFFAYFYKDNKEVEFSTIQNTD